MRVCGEGLHGCSEGPKGARGGKREGVKRRPWEGLMGMESLATGRRPQVRVRVRAKVRVRVAFIFSRRSFSHLTFSAARAFSSTASAASSSAGASSAARPSPIACSSVTQSRPVCL